VRKQDYRGFLAVVERAAGHEDTVLFLDGPSLGLARRYEMADSPVKIVNLKDGEHSMAEVTGRVAELAAEYPHLWLASDGGADGSAKGWLDREAFAVAEESHQDVTLRHYYDPASDPTVAEAAEATLSGQSALVSLTARLPRRARAGTILPVELAWRPAGAVLEPQKVSVRLVDPARPDSPVASADRPPQNGARSTTTWRAGEAIVDRHGLAVPPELTGEFRLQVVLYDAEGLTETARWEGPMVRVEPVR
jgi:hypothetical protein